MREHAKEDLVTNTKMVYNLGKCFQNQYLRFLRDHSRKSYTHQMNACMTIIDVLVVVTVLRKEDATISGYDSRSSLRHVHCPRCGKTITHTP